MTQREPMVFVSWAEDCSRSDSIAAHLGGRSEKIYAKFWGSQYSTVLFKYATQALQTLQVLRKNKARIIIVMTPPVVACFPVWLYARVTRSIYAIDAHTGALLDPRWKRLLRLHRFFSRHAATTLVTNTHLAEIVRSWGASATVVPDVPVLFPAPAELAVSRAQYNMTFVSSFTWDEPLDVFLEAAKSLPEVHFYVTGKVPEDRQTTLRNCSANVTFTGFLPRSKFAGLIRKSDAIISLTTLDHTMQRAAYEAIYLGKPVITSRFPLLEREFDRGTVHVENSVESIINGVRAMCSNLSTYTAGAGVLKQQKLQRWKKSEAALRGMLSRSTHISSAH
jgi:glycosyltransferase involved in cell wall biosynthesis